MTFHPKILGLAVTRQPRRLVSLVPHSSAATCRSAVTLCLSLLFRSENKESGFRRREKESPIERGVYYARDRARKI